MKHGVETQTFMDNERLYCQGSGCSGDEAGVAEGGGMDM